MSLFDKINLPPSKYKVHTFTSTGTSTFAVTGSGDVEYLVVAGGGGGSGGGGGAGGFLTATGFGVTAQSYSVTVGGGGADGAYQSKGSDGSDSIFSTITATGGGGAGAGGSSGNAVGRSGGSGGGGGAYVAGGNFAGGSGTSGQGNDGGVGLPVTNSGAGGGGGAGSVGVSGSVAQVGGGGGDGIASSITGSSVYYAGGGGAMSGNTNAGGSGGVGGGGDGGDGGVYIGDDGTANTGGGGGGGENNAGSGGSGIVIIRYLTSSGITATGGTITNVSVPVILSQRVVENFSGSVLDTDRWNTRMDGTVTFAMSDSVDGGFSITTSGANYDNGFIDFNAIRQFSPTASVNIWTGKAFQITSVTHNNVVFWGLINDNANGFVTGKHYVAAEMHSGVANFSISTGNGSAIGRTSTSVARNTVLNTHKLELKSASAEYSINGIFEVSRTATLPTVRLQPQFEVLANDSKVYEGSATYMEAYNT